MVLTKLRIIRNDLIALWILLDDERAYGRHPFHRAHLAWQHHRHLAARHA
jgi:hypothetical protein